jgi:hypothetical protein
LHWILAGVWANYQPGEFLELEGEFQSLVVAAYEANGQIEAVIADDRMRKMKADSKRKR